MFFTLQGEGAQAGRAAVFCRFAGCNLWSGREQDRASAICQFCDTDFVGVNGQGGGKFGSAKSLSQAVADCWANGHGAPSRLVSNGFRPYVVITGGEPMLQLTEELIDCLHGQGFEVALETNGTIPVPSSVDWICVSPKQGSELVQKIGHELKVVVPQTGQDLEALSALDFRHFFVQPMDAADPQVKASNLKAAINVCLKQPKWRLSVQTHKIIGMP